MGLCRYCGEKAGWFRDVHQACVDSARQGCERVVATITCTVKEKLIPPDNHPNTDTWIPSFAIEVWQQVKPTLDQIVAEHKIPIADVRNALLQGWSTGVKQVALAEPLTPDSKYAMTAFHRAMGITDEQASNTDASTAAALSVLLWSVMIHGDPTIIAQNVTHPFNVKEGEIPVIFFGNVMYFKETISRSQEGSGIKRKDVDYGGLLLTTQNIYFGGAHIRFRIPYEKVISFRHYSDGIGLFRDRASAKAEVFALLEPNPNGGDPVSARPMFGWFLFNLAHFLAQPQARARYATPKRRRSAA
jgi:hypothetical protein